MKSFFIILFLLSIIITAQAKESQLSRLNILIDAPVFSFKDDGSALFADDHWAQTVRDGDTEYTNRGPRYTYKIRTSKVNGNIDNIK